ncbi:50S ribosomal protein L23 [Calycomorphotria hydatis]|uniref:Large ribosomal subunit protein uL23 n=1 Tax=Calycomorphotria hydatis TaxID=2528027 RepID=A0A517T8D1_9PLAN|nr:50S ribosomal protein L23 [Calycomorphotria hydatis]QDT64607.1 50S ribosomal protein L23 [Calycomorphotria hydatis]
MADNVQAEQDEQQKGLKLEPYQVVIRPLVTEKGVHISEKYNAYSFEVHPQAGKPEIKNAVETIWNVRVVGVRTQNRKGKARRSRFAKGFTRGWKKAIVELHEDDRISFF